MKVVPIIVTLAIVLLSSACHAVKPSLSADDVFIGGKPMSTPSLSTPVGN